MSRRFDRKKKVINLAKYVVDDWVKRPEFWSQYLKPKPRFIPLFLWKKFVKIILK